MRSYQRGRAWPSNCASSRKCMPFSARAFPAFSSISFTQVGDRCSSLMATVLSVSSLSMDIGRTPKNSAIKYSIKSTQKESPPLNLLCCHLAPDGFSLVMYSPLFNCGGTLECGRYLLLSKKDKYTTSSSTSSESPPFA